MGKTKTAVISGEEAKPKKKAVTGVGLKGGERIKVVSGGPEVNEAEKPVETAEKAQEAVREPRVRSKKYQEAKGKVDRAKLYPIPEAVALVKGTSYSKFDGTVEMHLVVKKVGTTAKVELPHSTGKTKRVEVASEKTIESLKKGEINFDVLLATAEMMPKLVPFAKLLGPRGLMPNPKAGTLIKSEAEAKNFSEATLNLKTEKKAPLMHVVVGKVSLKEDALAENVEAVLEVLKNQVEKAYLVASMGPSVKLQVV